MEHIRKKLELTKENYYKVHLDILNSILPEKLTNKEREVLAVFLSLEGDLARDPLSTTGRKIVKERLHMSSGGLGNHLEALKEKGFILDNSIIPLVIPETNNQEYQFKIEWK